MNTNTVKSRQAVQYGLPNQLSPHDDPAKLGHFLYASHSIPSSHRQVPLLSNADVKPSMVKVNSWLCCWHVNLKRGKLKFGDRFPNINKVSKECLLKPKVNPQALHHDITHYCRFSNMAR